MKTFFLAGQKCESSKSLEVRSKYNNELIDSVYLADNNHIEQALEQGNNAKQAMANLKAWQKTNILNQCIEQFKIRYDELARIVTEESGKPIKDSYSEVDRLISTFQFAVHEANNQHGEILPMDSRESTSNYHCFTKRVPIGLCIFITPFNFPLNLVAHKIAPAIAAGCPFIVKPSEKTPLSALLLGEILASSDLPENAFSILPCTIEDSYKLIKDDRAEFLSFTGSSEIGWLIKNQSGRKKLTLELGGVATCALMADTDIDYAVDRLILGAFYQSGQSCISVQRVLIHDSIYEEVKQRLLDKTKQLICGDPSDPNTFIGPLIDLKSCNRVRSIINDAIEQGAKLLTDNLGDSHLIPACILENVPKNHTLLSEEIFGPVMCTESFSDNHDVIDTINSSEYAIHCGIFTNDLSFSMKCWEAINSPGIIIGDIPSWRADNMPYGGSKLSGLGREGLRYAIDEMSEIKSLVIHP